MQRGLGSELGGCTCTWQEVSRGKSGSLNSSATILKVLVGTGKKQGENPTQARVQVGDTTPGFLNAFL